MNVLLIGSGGREHALAWALSASPQLTRLYCAPGNAGIAEVATCVALDVADHGAVVRFCAEKGIGLVVVGPEVPLVAGIVDDLAAAKIKVFGPSKAAAQLEGSKGFTKDLCREFSIPTGAYGRFTDASSAKAYLARQKLPIVIKADGLAAGKGVVIAETTAAAETAIEACFAGAFGAAGAEIVIEEFLEGEEASFFALCDGEHVLPLATAQDHKRVGDRDTGPNTGGMGAYSPAPVMTPEMTRRVMDEIIRPTVRGMAARGTPFKGVLFLGVMITSDGPKLYEYNVRFGDPEAQVLMMRLKSDLLAALIATVDGVLGSFDLRWHDDAALGVVMAAEGYPGDYAKGTEIRGLERARAVPGVEIFHAGTRREGGRLLANGGRVLCVTARGRTVAEAQARAYEAVRAIDWPGGFYRTDIGWRAIARERGQEMGEDMNVIADLFPGFAEHRIKTDGAEIFVRTGGSGPPLLLLHGYPQTHVTWHKIAPELARHVTLVLADLRGYGASSAPAGDAGHTVYSKRAMAEDCLAVMRALGHPRFMVGGHDRGGRVAYRLALDHPEAVRALLPIDILPTAEVWRRITAERAVSGYHWAFLAQPHPLPETLIGSDPVYYLEHTLKSWAGPRDLSPFSAQALAHYRALLKEPARVHAVCEDYRSGAGIDRQLDEADLAAGRKIACATFVLWGSDYLGRGSANPLEVWRAWCTSVDGAEVKSGHFLAEENPQATLAALVPFLAANSGGA